MYGKFKTTLHSFTLKKENLLPLLLVLIVSTYLLFYIWPTNINGDGAMHAFLTRKMVENGGLLDHIPFAIERIDNGNLIYEPVPYPETVYVVWSVFYVLGREQLLKLSCIFFAALTALCFSAFKGYRQICWFFRARKKVRHPLVYYRRKLKVIKKVGLHRAGMRIVRSAKTVYLSKPTI